MEQKKYHRGRRKPKAHGRSDSQSIKAHKQNGTQSDSQSIKAHKQNGVQSDSQSIKAHKPNEAQGKKSHGHRGAQKKKGKSNIVSNVVLVIAIVVFCFSAFQLFRIFSGYQKGKSEYDKVKKLAITETKPDDKEEPSFWVDFDELAKINPDTVGWIRFSPQPEQISYPLVQADDNDKYLHKTFSANDNTVGAIFVNCFNNADFNDRNTIIYGHRMRDSSMFHDLEKYKEKSFWEENPYFYIYTPDGREIQYHIFSAGIVKDVSETYQTEFTDDAAFQAFLDNIETAKAYETGVEVDQADQIVTLSTCTAASDDNRMVVRGVKVSEKEMEKPE